MKSLFAGSGSKQELMEDGVSHSPWETLYKTVCVERPPDYSFY
jgi:casein kinase II subunit alpha